ncbi:transcription antitermination factor NusB [Apilactobacillus timberlakei]|uniref:Transcription antitermination protein NusB n=1 Tax=Apilactobacillus timberlakei TaxID=2008380 RepID=A0ABY2YTJ6_9LACO|nr:transcription antitermination factor NusB [Apilactobacillus timberlakei]TPR13997.1 transcription antitermination factor NusB [Apilactobacillus timberlakei]TPR15313.1 transcription antitermination factor NusB [Apilactobacillus timberlakei]TPR16844.1 transcription antitermination factor NusB [Apilactobacillus timberlakei]TPR17204.1 transcription antitermination factor NusB [Apilactobacillus timberlakei]TPR20216.1 transcription antitermination factor NusB [Apilactobacillus timberlakei]
MNFTRHKIREFAFQTLFAINANDTTDKELFFHAISKTQDEIPSYYLELVNGVLEHKEDLDNKISEYLVSGWSINRIAKTDLAVLRMAFFEIYYVDDIPNKVAINEALELTKKYSDDHSRKFVNGVLSNAIS